MKYVGQGGDRRDQRRRESDRGIKRYEEIRRVREGIRESVKR